MITLSIIYIQVKVKTKVTLTLHSGRRHFTWIKCVAHFVSANEFLKLRQSHALRPVVNAPFIIDGAIVVEFILNCSVLPAFIYRIMK